MLSINNCSTLQNVKVEQKIQTDSINQYKILLLEDVAQEVGFNVLMDYDIANLSAEHLRKHFIKVITSLDRVNTKEKREHIETYLSILTSACHDKKLSVRDKVCRALCGAYKLIPQRLQEEIGWIMVDSIMIYHSDILDNKGDKRYFNCSSYRDYCRIVQKVIKDKNEKLFTQNDSLSSDFLQLNKNIQLLLDGKVVDRFQERQPNNLPFEYRITITDSDSSSTTSVRGKFSSGSETESSETSTSSEKSKQNSNTSSSENTNSLKFSGREQILLKEKNVLNSLEQQRIVNNENSVIDHTIKTDNEIATSTLLAHNESEKSSDESSCSTDSFFLLKEEGTIPDVDLIVKKYKDLETISEEKESVETIVLAPETPTRRRNALVEEMKCWLTSFNRTTSDPYSRDIDRDRRPDNTKEKNGIYTVIKCEDMYKENLFNNKTTTLYATSDTQEVRKFKIVKISCGKIYGLENPHYLLANFAKYYKDQVYYRDDVVSIRSIERLTLANLVDNFDSGVLVFDPKTKECMFTYLEPMKVDTKNNPVTDGILKRKFKNLLHKYD